MKCSHRSPAGRLFCSRTAPHDPAATGGHVYEHDSAAPDLKADLDQHLDDVEVARIKASNR